MFYCFGCHEGGSIVDFIMKLENCDFVRAIEILAESEHHTLKMAEDDPEYEERLKKRKRILDLNKEAANFYYMMLKKPYCAEGLKYIKESRGLSDENIKAFAIGASPYYFKDYEGQKETVIDYLKSKGFNEQEMIDAGIVLKSSKNDEYYDRFSGRVMFPIQDENDNVLGFSGRAYGERAKRDDVAKYYNTSDTLVFNKKFHAFGLNKAKKSKENNFILVEGNMDVVSLHCHGVDNAIASLGTALTEEQAKLMRKRKREVVICYDTDSAGRAATLRSIPILMNAGLEVRVMNLSEGKDPDEFIKTKGRDAFMVESEKAVPAIEYEIETLSREKNLRDSGGQRQLITECVDRIKNLNNSVDKELYIQKLAQKVKMSEDVIRGEVIGLNKKDGKKEEQAPKSAENVAQSAAGKNEDNEKKLVSILLNIKSLFKQIKKYIPEGSLETELLNKVLSDAYDTEVKEGAIEMSTFINHYEDAEERKFVNDVYFLMENASEDDSRKVAEIILKDMRIKKVDDRVQTLIKQIEVEQDPTKKVNLSQELSKLIKEKHDINNKSLLSDDDEGEYDE
ncbi:MAG: DNA primase [Clostridia bacterium]|nr:DNA primase [Clostridia bacterium]